MDALPLSPTQPLPAAACHAKRRPPRRGFPAPRPVVAGAALLLAGVGLGATAALTITAETGSQLSAPGGLATFAGNLTGMVGTYLALMMVLLVSRIPEDHHDRAEQAQQHRWRPLAPVGRGTGVVASEPPGRASHLDQHRRDEHHADEHMRREQLVHAQDRGALGRQQYQQHGRISRRQAGIAGRARIGPALRAAAVLPGRTAPSARPALISAPPGWIDQLAGVLMDNACRYAGPDGVVRIGVRADGGRISLTVEDSGPGIVEAERPRLFDRFHRVTGRGPGAGLGLAIGDSIVRSTGGRWHVGESPLGGALMVVTWRRNPAPRRLAGPGVSAVAGSGPAGGAAGPANRLPGASVSSRPAAAGRSHRGC